MMETDKEMLRFMYELGRHHYVLRNFLSNFASRVMETSAWDATHRRYFDFLLKEMNRFESEVVGGCLERKENG